MNANADAIILGGDVNGLTAAATLALAGRKVILLEEADHFGGIAAGGIFQNRYRHRGVWFDTSLLREEVIDALQLGRHGLKRASKRQALYLPDPEGRGFLIDGELAKAVEDIAMVSEKDAAKYEAFRRFITRIAPFMNRLFDDIPLTQENPGLSEIINLAKTGLSLRRLGRDDMLEILRINLLCAADWVDEWFESPRLKAGLAAPAIFASETGPWSPGNNLNLVRWECGARGPVDGGAPALVDALLRAAKTAGADLRCSQAVQNVAIENGKVQGVTLQSGETITAATVLSTLHPSKLFMEKIQGQHIDQRLEHLITNYRSRGTTGVLHLALGKIPNCPNRPDLGLARIRLVSEVDDMERAFDATKYDEAAKLPWLDMHIATEESESDAEGVATVWIHHVPYQPREEWTAESREILLQNTYSVLDRFLPNFSKSVLAAELLTPEDLEARYGLIGGHLTMGEQAIDQSLVRPFLDANGYATSIPGLYLCGDASRPGGGLSCMPGLLGARASLRGK